MPTLVLSPRYTSDSRDLRAAAVAAGWRVERLGGWRPPDRLRDHDVVLYGEPLFVEVIAAGLGRALIDAPFDWLLGLPERHRRRTIELTTMGHARTVREPVFVKPADGRKGFEGAVYGPDAELPSTEAQPDDTPVFTAEPVAWEVEFRCFVLDRRIAAMSPYLREGRFALSADGTWQADAGDAGQAAAYAEELLADKDVSMPPAIVIDIGRVRGRGWAVIEANSAWGAGIYGCEPRRVLDVLARACVSRDRLQPGDAPWVLDPVEVTGG
ncbi:ATP-grasp domain-containing protein [Actinomadura sp. HBU206391]|uniref:ATP-grasp domain-containing protein n=1 Tax=Actinomadura sp. HBU206391 TaxID=2731692 RepID=UPI001650C1F3|nr:ATP-grasp domain-containing protein [Actinomadura sp. HBU206391]MBC6459980.1 ATP-grasp domain-containing protein [Actinomadura sp. HBU206391]